MHLKKKQQKNENFGITIKIRKLIIKGLRSNLTLVKSSTCSCEMKALKHTLCLFYFMCVLIMLCEILPALQNTWFIKALHNQWLIVRAQFIHWREISPPAGYQFIRRKKILTFKIIYSHSKQTHVTFILLWNTKGKKL